VQAADKLKRPSRAIQEALLVIRRDVQRVILLVTEQDVAAKARRASATPIRFRHAEVRKCLGLKARLDFVE
jgi:hypothetical protein